MPIDHFVKNTHSYVMIFLIMCLILSVSCVRQADDITVRPDLAENQQTASVQDAPQKTKAEQRKLYTDAERRKLYEEQMRNHQSDDAAKTVSLIHNKNERNRLLREICQQQCRASRKSLTPEKMIRKAIRTGQLMDEGKDRYYATLSIVNLLCDYREEYAADQAFIIAALAGRQYVDNVRRHILNRTLDDYGDHPLSSEQLKSRIAWAEEKLKKMQSPLEKGLVLTHIALRSFHSLDRDTFRLYTDKAVQMLKTHPEYPPEKTNALFELTITEADIFYQSQNDINWKTAGYYGVSENSLIRFASWRTVQDEESKDPELLKNIFLAIKDMLNNVDDNWVDSEKTLFFHLIHSSFLLKAIGDPEFAEFHVFDLMENFKNSDLAKDLENPSDQYRIIWIPFADILAELGKKDAARSIYILYEPIDHLDGRRTEGIPPAFPFTQDEFNRFAPFLFPVSYDFSVDFHETGAILGLVKSGFYDDALRILKKTPTDPISFCYFCSVIAEEYIKTGETERILEIQNGLKKSFYITGYIAIDRLIRQAMENKQPGFEEFDYPVTVDDLVEMMHAKLPDFAFSGIPNSRVDKDPIHALLKSQSFYYVANLVLQEKQDQELAKELIFEGIACALAAKNDRIQRNNKYLVKELVILQGIRMVLNLDPTNEQCPPLIQAVLAMIKTDSSDHHLAYNYFPDEKATQEYGRFPETSALHVVVYEWIDVVNQAGDRDSLIELMDYYFHDNTARYQFPEKFWQRSRNLIVGKTTDSPEKDPPE